MIDLALIQGLSAELEALRGTGRELLTFDTRDHGNYGPYNLKRDWELLGRMDPTGFASALLLDEMIEATIRGSSLPLTRVLREEGYLGSVRKILDIKSRLMAVLTEPREAFTARVTEALATISPEYGEIAPLELACCLRDALFSLDKGLTLSWLRCDTPALTGPLPLASSAYHFPNMPAFLQALQYEMPYGAFVACINHRETALGFKQPGRIAYLSRFVINTHFGQLQQAAKSGSNLAERFDLGEASERFPDWTPARTKWARQQGAQGSGYMVEPSQQSTVTALSDLPRDVVLWIALLTEMMRQRLATTDATTVVLTESMVRALPAPAALPVVQSNYTLSLPALAAVFDSLGLTDPWLVAQCQVAMEGLTLAHMLPTGEHALGLHLESKELVSWPEQSDCYSRPGGYDGFRANHVQITPVSANLVGTREILEAARLTIVRRNLMTYLQEWVNRKVALCWLTETHDWFRAAVAKRLPQILKHPMVMKSDLEVMGVIHFYNQSTKHKTFRAKCWINPRLDPSCRLVIAPRNSADLVSVLGLGSEDELPAFLRGWSRLPDDRDASRDSRGVSLRWAWNNLPEGGIYEHQDALGMRQRQVATQGFLIATVSVNEASIDTSAMTLVNSRNYAPQC